MIVVSQYRRHDAAGAVGRRGNHAAAGGVFFVNRQREHVDPVDHVHRIAGQFVRRHQHAAQRGGTARHAQRPRQHAFGVQTAIDTGAHGLPDVAEVGLDLLLAVQRQFVLHHHAGQRQPGLAAVIEHFARGVERIGHLQLLLGVLTEVLLVDDETAADRVIGLAVHFFIAGEGVDLHAVFMQRQVVAAEDHAAVAGEIDFMQAVGQHQALTLFYIANKTRNAIDIDVVRHVAGQAENDGDIGMVTFSGQ